MNLTELGELSYLDRLNIVGVWLSMLNLEQNIEQSKEQDINKANEKQQHQMLSEIHREFELQNMMLEKLIYKVDRIEKKMEVL